MNTEAEVIIRNTTPAHFDDIRELQRKVYPGLKPWSYEQLENHLKVFAEGQFVADLEGRIVGTSSSFIIMWDEYGPEHNWKEITGAGMFSTHNPSGKTLYGAEVCVDPEFRKKGIGQKIYQERRELCRRLNLKRIIAAGRLPNYYLHAGNLDPHTYCLKVIWGDIYDPVLRFQLKQGFQFCDIVENYLHGDTQSLEYASLIVWLNPKYNPNFDKKEK
ncbi:MAG: GNAT family N-acetyltransferase [Ignavibacteriaceae bacterium]